MIFFLMPLFLLFSYQVPCFAASTYQSYSDDIFFDEIKAEQLLKSQNYGELMAHFSGCYTDKNAQKFIEKHADDRGNVIALYVSVWSRIEQSHCITLGREECEVLSSRLLVCLIRIALDCVLFHYAYGPFLPNRKKNARSCYSFFKRSLVKIATTAQLCNFRTALERANQWFSERAEMFFEPYNWIGYCYVREESLIEKFSAMCFAAFVERLPLIDFDPVDPLIEKITILDKEIACSVRMNILSNIFTLFRRCGDWAYFFSLPDDLGFLELEKFSKQLDAQVSWCSLL